MTILYLLRHAHAGDPARWHGDDDVRPLSERGRRQAERLGRLLSGAEEAPDLFITSPKLRARDTARIVAKILDAEVVEDARLAEPLDPGIVTEIVLAAGPSARPCIVGHDPDFSMLLAELTGAPAIQMRKGALARVETEGRDLAPGRATLRLLVPPEVLGPR
jgi:phosphohistidine phosphatase SixA